MQAPRDPPASFEFVFATDERRCDAVYVEINYCGHYVGDVLLNDAGELKFETVAESFFPKAQAVPLHDLIEALEYARDALSYRRQIDPE